MKTAIKDWLKVMVLLLDEAAAVVLVLLALRALGIRIPLPITIVAAILLGVLVFLVHKAVIPTFHQKRITGADELTGLVCRVIEPLTPNGMVRVKDEYWKARSVEDNIEAGEEVEILGLEGLTLKVKRKGK